MAWMICSHLLARPRTTARLWWHLTSVSDPSRPNSASTNAWRGMKHSISRVMVTSILAPHCWVPGFARATFVKCSLSRSGTDRKCRKCRTIRAKRSKDHAGPATISTTVAGPAVGRLSPTPVTSLHHFRCACIEQLWSGNPSNKPACKSCRGIWGIR